MPYILNLKSLMKYYYTCPDYVQFKDPCQQGRDTGTFLFVRIISYCSISLLDNCHPGKTVDIHDNLPLCRIIYILTMSQVKLRLTDSLALIWCHQSNISEHVNLIRLAPTCRLNSFYKWNMAARNCLLKGTEGRK